MSSGYFFYLRKCKYGLAQIQDICSKGMGLLTQEDLEPFFPLEMWLSIPECDEFFYCLGDVVWSREVEPGQYKAGLKLKNPIPEEITRTVSRRFIV
jgi:hypothetical protein